MTMKTYINTASDPITRIAKLIFRLCRGEELTARIIKDDYGVSWATAKRDLVRLERALPCAVEEVHTGGAGYMPHHKTLSLMQGLKSLKLVRERSQ